VRHFRALLLQNGETVNSTTTTCLPIHTGEHVNIHSSLEGSIATPFEPNTVIRASIVAGPGGADKQLVAALYEEFLATLVDAVEADVNDAKVPWATCEEILSVSVRDLPETTEVIECNWFEGPILLGHSSSALAPGGNSTSQAFLFESHWIQRTSTHAQCRELFV
jgi:hypothetical protein